MSHHDPALAWEAIKLVVDSYSEDELLSESDTEAKNTVGNTAAGPLEDLFLEYGPQFIDAAENAAFNDRRVRWAFGCLRQLFITDEVGAGADRGL